MKGNIMLNQTNQMELGISGANRCPRSLQRERRRMHARWWFDRMRQVVEQADDFQPVPRFQPELMSMAEKPDTDNDR